ncbi:MAG: hypothetical protein K6348_06100 [Deferribacterales bacterium]
MRTLKEVYNSSTFIELIFKFVEYNYGLKINEQNVNCVLNILYSVFDGFPQTEEDLERFVENNLHRCIFNNESYFFRNEPQLNYLKSVVKSGSYLNILSFGCAEGQEAYSISIVLTELGIRHNVYGVDISEHSIKDAVDGIYKEYDLKNLGEEYKKYFKKCKNGYCIDDGLKKNVEFFKINILKNTLDNLFNFKFDMIFCNNVLIYGNDNFKEYSARQLLAVLDYNGLLFTTKEEEEFFQGLYLLSRVSDNPVVFKKLDFKSVFEKDYRELYEFGDWDNKKIDSDLSENIRLYENDLAKEFSIEKCRELVNLLLNNNLLSEAKKWQYVILIADEYNKDDINRYLEILLLLGEYEEYLKILQKKVDIYKDKDDMKNLIEILKKVGNVNLLMGYQNMYKKLFGEYDDKD